ncbi:MAG: hypothetical protein AB7I19_18735 [Planctomycetota bacterium]
MNHLRNTLAFALSCAAFAGAQTLCPRPETQLSSGNVTTSIYGFAAWQIAAPKDFVSANATLGYVANSRVVYAAWVDRSSATATDVVLRFLRSEDGGFSWNTANAIDVWTSNSAVGETFDGVDLDLLADGNNVFLVITADRLSNGQPHPTQQDNCWVIGSNDQGRTWQSICVSRGTETALTTGDLLRDVDDPIAASGNGRCHVVFESDYQSAAGRGGAATGLEDVYYQAVEFDAQGNLVLVFPEERQLESTPSGTVDTDFPGVAVDGNNLVFTWQDNRISVTGTPPAYSDNNRYNDSFSRTSADGGTSLNAEHNHTNFQVVNLPPWDQRQTRCAISGQTVFVMQEDPRNGNDDVFLSRSTDLGANWVDGVVVSLSPAGVDSDRTGITIAGNTVVIAYCDDRQGSGNADNDVYVVVDHNLGADFLAGTQVEHIAIDTPTSCTLYNLDSFGEVFAVAAETSAFPEDAGVAFSRDFGDSWEWCATLQFGNADCDDIYVAVTQNRDVQVVWQDDDNQGNDFNNVYTRGLRTPKLVDRTAAGIGYVYEGFSRSDDFNLAILFASLSGPGSNGLLLDSQRGVGLNLLPDGLTLGIVSNLPTFLLLVDPNVPGSTTWAFPNFAQILGLQITWAVATYDSVNSRFATGFTDPIVQR